uniref:RING-type domain-containing protein n=1 Tax=Anopheles dirus TaxID=7168 RepID=A0A182NKV2_9DIPT
MKPKLEPRSRKRTTRVTRSPSMGVSAPQLRHQYNLRGKGPPRYVIFSDVECPICLGDYNSPVIVNCGHSFCKACIEECRKTGNRMTCPVCKEKLVVELFIESVDYTKRLSLGGKSSAV